VAVFTIKFVPLTDAEGDGEPSGDGLDDGDLVRCYLEYYNYKTGNL